MGFLIGGEILLHGMETRFEASDGDAVRAAGHFHLKDAQIYPDLKHGTSLWPFNDSHEKTTRLMGPGLQDFTEILLSHMCSDVLWHSIKHGTWVEDANLGEKPHPGPVVRPVLVGGLPMGWFRFQFTLLACLRVKIPRFYTDLNARKASRFAMKAVSDWFTGVEGLKDRIQDRNHEELSS